MQPIQPPIRTSGTNGLAIASLVLGIVWLFGLGSLLALVLGLVALRQIKRSGQEGRGLAIAASILGAIGIVGAVTILAVTIAAVSETTAQIGTLDEGFEDDSAQVAEEAPVPTDPKTEPPFELSTNAMRDDPVCQDALDRYLASPTGSIEEQDATDDLEVFCRAGALEDIPECERALESSYSADPAEAWGGYDEFTDLGCPGSLAPPNMDRP